MAEATARRLVRINPDAEMSTPVVTRAGAEGDETTSATTAGETSAWRSPAAMAGNAGPAFAGGLPAGAPGSSALAAAAEGAGEAGGVGFPGFAGGLPAGVPPQAITRARDASDAPPAEASVARAGARPPDHTSTHEPSKPSNVLKRGACMLQVNHKLLTPRQSRRASDGANAPFFPFLCSAPDGRIDEARSILDE